jgi:RNA polymerase sigma factor (TIGR02999 family)
MSGNITQLLRRWKDGDAEAGARVVERTYRELRQIAGAHMRRERFAQSLGATGLLHEAYLRLLRNGPPGTVESRQQFLRLMAAEMRRRLIDRARHRLSKKRGAGVHHEPLHDETAALVSPPAEADLDLDRLDRALETSWPASRAPRESSSSAFCSA